jgi:hypothetical protein
MSISGGQKRNKNYKQNPATTIEKNTEEREKIADSTGDTKSMKERERGREEGALEIPRNVHAHALGILKFHRIPQNINAGAAWNLGTH